MYEHILLFSLLLLSLQDYQTMHVDILNISFFSCIALFGTNYWHGIAIFIILLIIFFKTKGLGFADVITISGCCNFLEAEQIGIFLVIIGVLSSTTMKILKKEKLPLIPFIFLSLTVIFLFPYLFSKLFCNYIF